MRKSDKKLEKQIVQALTQVCDEALKELEGFQWLTHLVNYSQFPQSLKIVCVFDTHERVVAMQGSSDEERLLNELLKAMANIGVSMKHPKRQIFFDSEEACERDHRGKWADRLAERY